MSTENKKIPALRFPEFENDGEWEEKDLEYFLEYIQPAEYLVSDTNYSDKFKTPVLTAGKTFILGYTDETDGIFQKNLPIIIFDDFTTSSQFVDFPFKAKSSAMKILIAKKNANIKFVFESMQMIRYEVGVHQRHWISIFSKLKILAPSLPEQQKIASCLSSLDEVIGAESQKLEALKAHKKGLMQGLFPMDNGELTIDNYRTKLTFPDVDEGWATARLGDLVSFKVTNSFSRDNLNYKYGTVKNIHYGDIHTKFQNLFDITKETVPFINSDIDIQKMKEENYCQEGDVVFADASEDLADVGKSIEIVNLNNEKVVSGLHTILARPEKGLFPKGFLGYLFKSEFIRKQIQKESQGTKVLSISPSRLQNLIIHYPLSIIHSNKIAACLSSLDALITAQVEKIGLLQQQKKGLMQGLFPKMDG